MAPDPLRDLKHRAVAALTDATRATVDELLQDAYDLGHEAGVQEAKDTVDHWYEPPET